MKELAEGVMVDGEVIDGFVGDRGFAGSERGLREHAHDSSSVGTRKGFVLIEISVIVSVQYRYPELRNKEAVREL